MEIGLFIGYRWLFWKNGCNAEEEVVVRDYLGKLSDLLLYIDGIGLSEAWQFKPLLTVRN